MKKLTNSIKLDLPSCPLNPLIVIKNIHKVYNFLWRFVRNWPIPEFIREQTFWRFTEDAYKILRYKVRQKKNHFAKNMS